MLRTFRMKLLRTTFLLFLCSIVIKECISRKAKDPENQKDVQNVIRETTKKDKKKFKPPPPKDVSKSVESRRSDQIDLFKNRQDGWCKYISNLMKKKTIAVKRVDGAIKHVEENKDMPTSERDYHIARFHVMQQELNETDDMIVSSFRWLEETLNDDYKDIINMKDGAKKRLEKLRDATLREEQEYSTLLKAEEQRKALNETNVRGMVEDILHDVALAANQLEQDLDDHVFDNAVHDPNLANGANIEAVIRIEDEEKSKPEDDNSTVKKSKDAVGVIKLVDVQDNQFVLSKGKDSTVPHEDHHLIEDVVYLMVLSFILGWLCTLIGLPSMFGYILAGVILGPSGGNVLKSLVQVETFGEFGVFFILFSVGLEFSPDKIKKVLKVSALGGSLMMMFMVLCGLGLSFLLKSKPTEGAFVAACLSLSSTPLVVKFLSPSGDDNGEDSPSNTDYGITLMGILIMQDVLLGVLMALLPNMADTGIQTDISYNLYFMIGFRLICAMMAVVLISFISSHLIIKYLFIRLVKNSSKEIIALASISIAFIMLQLTEYLQVSMELGCFLAGAMISGQGHGLADQIEQIIQPIKDFLGCIFFVSIGLHVFPSFMVYEMTYLTTFTLLIVSFKFIISAIVLAMVLPRSSRSVKWIVSAGLAQVSEFSFVLGSRARRLGLVSREVYLLILSVTTLSLLMAPIVWRATLWQLRIKHRRISRFAAVYQGTTMSPGHSGSSGHASPETTDVDDFVIVSSGSTKPGLQKKRKTPSN